MKLVTLYDDKGRIKLPKEVLKWLKVKKGDKLVVMEVEGERSIKLVPVDEFKRTVKWPRLEGINEDKALSEKTLALYEMV